MSNFSSRIKCIWHGKCLVNLSEKDDIENIVSKPPWWSAEVDDAKKVDVLLQYLDVGVSLVMHEDKHNWQKFYNLIYITLGLLAGYGLILRGGSLEDWPPRAFLVLISILGLLSSIGFLPVLWSGVCCLAAHKTTVAAADRAFAKLLDEFSDESPATAFLGFAGPPRQLLRWTPVVTAVVWLVLGFVPFCPVFFSGQSGTTTQKMASQLEDGSLEPTQNSKDTTSSDPETINTGNTIESDPRPPQATQPEETTDDS